MTATLTEADDQIKAAFKTVWDADPASQTVPVLWPNVPDQKPPTTGDWVRFDIGHNTGGQPTVGSASGVRRYRYIGIVTVQIFVEAGKGSAKWKTLATIAKRAFEGVTTSGGVWFSNVRPNEIGASGDWYQVNVLAEFSYDEVR